jgi:5'-3' exonuclease
MLSPIGGYMNDFGKLNMKGCQFFLRGLADFERECFEGQTQDLQWLRGKRGDEKYLDGDNFESNFVFNCPILYLMDFR